MNKKYLKEVYNKAKAEKAVRLMLDVVIFATVNGIKLKDSK